MDPITNDILLENIKNIETNIVNSNKKESEKTKNVKILCDSDSYSLTELIRETTTQTKMDSKKPNITFENPLPKTDSKIYEISLVPKLNKEKIKVRVEINGIPVFQTKGDGAFTDIAESIIKIPNGKRIKNNKRINIYFWNGIDDEEISLTAQVTFGE